MLCSAIWTTGSMGRYLQIYSWFTNDAQTHVSASKRVDPFTNLCTVNKRSDIGCRYSVLVAAKIAICGYMEGPLAMDFMVYGDLLT